MCQVALKNTNANGTTSDSAWDTTFHLALTLDSGNEMWINTNYILTVHLTKFLTFDSLLLSKQDLLFKKAKSTSFYSYHQKFPFLNLFERYFSIGSY